MSVIGGKTDIDHSLLTNLDFCARDKSEQLPRGLLGLIEIGWPRQRQALNRGFVDLEIAQPAANLRPCGGLALNSHELDGLSKEHPLYEHFSGWRLRN